MRSVRYRQQVRDLQRHLAQLDAAQGKPPRKTAKSYREVYWRCVAGGG